MIPKKIHYCWFGGAEKSKKIQRCIASWKRYCPDYEIVEWNESNFDLDQHPYLRWCHNNKKWAFLSDFARLLVVYEHGGIYFRLGGVRSASAAPNDRSQAHWGRRQKIFACAPVVGG